MIRWRILAWLVFYLNIPKYTTSDFAAVIAKNVALNKPTIQSSVDTNSWNANDGRYNTITHTDFNGFNWWLIDLEEQIRIYAIKVYNRKNCCYERLSNFSILTSGVVNPGAPIPSNANWTTRLFRKRHAKEFFLKAFRPPLQTRYVAVSNNVSGAALSLSEIEIFDRPWTTNVALVKPSQQSHTWNEEVGADKVNNGMYDDWSDIAPVSTKWWAVDLQFTYSVIAFRIYDGREARGDVELTNSINIYHSSTKSSNITNVMWRRLKDDGRAKTYNYKQEITIEAWLEAVRHLKVVATHRHYLILAEVEVFIQNTPTYRKPTNQSSTYARHTSDLAVNGYRGDFTHTAPSGNRWWTVDLLEIFTIHYVVIRNRNEFMDNLQKLTLYLAKRNGNWVQHGYGKGPFGIRAYFKIASGAEARYINLTTTSYSGVLAFAEVTVFEHDFASLGEASQSSVVANQGPEKALDITPGTHAVSNFYTTTVQWWRVKLIKRILMTSTKLSFNKGNCTRYGDHTWVKCAEISGYIFIKTTKEENPPAITASKQARWPLCYTQKRMPYHTLHVKCESNYRYPVIKHLNIQPKYKAHRINLESCEIFGKKLPEFEDTSIAAIQSISFKSFQLIFKGWDVTDIGAFPPTSYELNLNESLRTRTIAASNLTDWSILITWNNLQPDTPYIYSITCYVFGMACEGKTITGVVKTKKFPTMTTTQTTKKSTTVTTTEELLTSAVSHESITTKSVLENTKPLTNQSSTADSKYNSSTRKPGQKNNTLNIDNEKEGRTYKTVSASREWYIVIIVPSAVILVVLIAGITAIACSKSENKDQVLMNQPMQFGEIRKPAAKPRLPISIQPSIKQIPFRAMSSNASQLKGPPRQTFTPRTSRPLRGLRGNI